MTDYLYYRRGEEWVRVDADRYERITKPGSSAGFSGGQCVIGYFVFYTYSANFQGTPRGGSGNVAFGEGPIIGMEIEYGPSNIDTAPNLGCYIYLNDSTGRNVVASFGGYNWQGQPTVQIDSIRRRDNQPDNCGDPPSTPATCETEFYRSGNLVLTLPDCPEITDGRGCSACCSDLLPILQGIRM